MGTGLEVKIFLFIVSTGYQIAQHNKMKRKMEAEADKRRGFRVTVRGQAAPLPVVYGRQMLGGIEVKHKVGTDYTFANSLAGTTVFNEGLAEVTVTGTKHEFLTVQTAICQSGIEGVTFVNIDGKPYNLKDEKFTHRLAINKNGGVAEPLATAQGIIQTNTFTDTAYSTAVYRLNREEPQYNGIPTTEFFVKGMKVREVLNNAGTYSLSGTYTFSNNPALCLLDYLLNTRYGKGLGLDDIDLGSFHHASQVCATTVLTGASAFGQIHGFKPVMDFPTFSEFPEVGEEAYLYQAEDTTTLYSWSDSGGVYSTYTTAGAVRSVPLYECNMTLQTDAKIRDNIDAILQTMNLAELIWSSEGKYKLLLDYPENQAQLLALIDSSHHFNEDSIMRESVDTNWVPLSERYNHVTVRYLNEHEDFKEDSKSWPPKTGSVYQTYLSEDNGQQLSTDVFFEGCSDPYHALSKAEQMVRQSRSMYTISLTVNKKGLTLEPGDFFSVSIASQGMSQEIFRVESIEVSSDLTAKITAYYFDSSFLAWNVADYEAYSTRPGVEARIPGPAAITATDTGSVNTDGVFSPAVELEWTASNDASVSNYELQYKVTTDATFNSYRTTQTTHTITGLRPGTQYTFRVRAINNVGRFSNFATVVHTVGGDTIATSTPTGLTATGHFKYISLEWTNPPEPDLAFIEIYENTVNSYSGAVLVGTTRDDSFIRSGLAVNQLKYYYIRAIDNTGNASSYTGIVSALTTFLDDPDFANGIYQIFKDQGLYAIEDVAGLPASGTFTGEKVFNTNDGKLYQWNGSSWETMTGANTFAELSGQLAAAQIAVDAVTNAAIANDAIQEDNIANLAISSAKIKANAVGPTQIANLAISSAKIAANAVGSTQIANLAITAGKVAASAIDTDKLANNAITETKIEANAVTTGKITANAITAGKINAGAVTATKIDANAVTADKILAGSVSAVKIASNAITSDKIDANAVTANKILAGSISAVKIASNAITSDKIDANAITSAKIAAGSVTATEIAAGSIIASKIGANAVTANAIAANSVTTSELAANAVTANNIVGGTITGDKITANTITGGLIAASGIITNSAQINNGVVANAQIGNAAITTAKIGSNMVTFPQSAQGASSIILQYTTTFVMTVVSLTVYNSGAPAQISGTMNASHSNNTPTTQANEYRSFDFQLFRGSSVLTGFNGMLVGGLNVISAIINKLDNPGAGYHTYTLKVRNVGGNTARTLLFYPTISYVELKR